MGFIIEHYWKIVTLALLLNFLTGVVRGYKTNNCKPVNLIEALDLVNRFGCELTKD